MQVLYCFIQMKFFIWWTTTNVITYELDVVEITAQLRIFGQIIFIICPFLIFPKYFLRQKRKLRWFRSNKIVDSYLKLLIQLELK